MNQPPARAATRTEPKDRATTKPSKDSGDAGRERMDIRRIPISEINPAPYNPRLDLQPGDERYDLLRKGIEEFGLCEPLVWNERTGTLVGGHQRLKILVERGDTEVDVVAVNLPRSKEKALNVSLNKNVGEWDLPKLKDLLAEIDTGEFDMGLTGFTDAAIAELMSQFQAAEDLQEVEEPEPPKQPVTQPADLWVCGKHRLLCGDSTKAEDVARVMNGERAILFATDPPYLVNYTGLNHPSKWSEKGTKRAQDKKNKDWTGTYGITWDDAEANPDLYQNFVRVAQEIAIEPNAAWYCWHATRNYPMLDQVWKGAGAFVHQVLVWVKDRGVLTFSYYLWQHEVCAFGWVKGHEPPRVAKDYPTTVWQIPTIRPGEKTDHPTSKPIQVFAIPMQQHVVMGGLCYEPFTGSGSQMLAGEQLKRRVYGLEISPRYVDVSLRRWQILTGKEAVLEGDGRSFREVAAARGVEVE